MIGESTRVTAVARESFLSSGRLPDRAAVRPEIVDSWRRSQLYGVGAAAVPVMRWSGRADGQLLRAARPVLDGRRARLAAVGGGLTLTDEEGTILERWVEDTRFARRLDARNVVAGACVSELTIGTNSGGLSVETGRPALVVGHEHFAQGAVTMATAGVPIRHPLHGRLIGSLNLNCSAKEAHPVLLSWIQELVDGIQDRLLESVSTRERALLDAYLRSAPDSRHPVVCLDAHTVITNAAAARLLDAQDQAALWEVAARRIAGAPGATVRLDLSTGHSVDVDTTPVTDGRRAIGAVVRLTRVSQADAAARGRAPSVGLPGLVGSGPSWRSFVADLRTASRGRAPVLVVGEPGTGKASAARSLAEGGLRELDAPTLHVAGSDAWQGALREALGAESGLVVLHRIDALDGAALAATVRLLGSAATAGELRVVATARTADVELPTGLLDWPGPVVTAPALRDRMEDLGPLLTALTRQATGSGDGPRWSAEVVQMLSRVSWPANLHGLAAVVGEVLRARPGSLVRAADLPAHVTARGARRNLARLEQAEAHTIMTALQQAGGNKRAAADALGIARSTLYRKVRALGLDLDAATF